MIFDKAGDYLNSDKITDGATIAVEGVTLTNANGAAILGSGLSFTAGGSSFINETTAEVGQRNEMSWYPGVLVQGSSGADTIMNAGIVWGQVRLGDGNDVFVDRGGLVDGVGYGTYLEGGDDLLLVEGANLTRGTLWANGGDGYDTVVVAFTGSDPRDAMLFGFEKLILETGGNIERYSGFQTVVLAAADPSPFYNFLYSNNPAADLSLSDQQTVSVFRSQFRSITGSDGNEAVRLASGGAFSELTARVVDDVRLGGGDDNFTIDAWFGGINPVVGGVIDGGDGADNFSLIVGNGNGGGGTTSLDLSNVAGFEGLFINTQYLNLAAVVTLSNLSDFQSLRAAKGTTLSISSTALPGVELRGAAGGKVTVGSDVTIGSYSAFSVDPVFDWPTPADLSLSVTMVNNGAIAGSVRFAEGSISTTVGVAVWAASLTAESEMIVCGAEMA